MVSRRLQSPPICPMIKIVLIPFFLVVTTAPAFAQLADAVSSKRLNFAYTYGKVDYVDLGKVAPNVSVVYFGRIYDPRERTRPMRNLDSFALNFRGWVLLDEYIVDPEFYWELNPSFLDGKTKRVEFVKISKYPSLVKRYKAIQPTSVNYIVCVELESTEDVLVQPSSTWLRKDVCFRALGYQMLWGGSRNGNDKTYPGALLGLTEGVSTDFNEIRRFTPQDITNIPATRNFLRHFRKVTPLIGRQNTWLDIKWPDDAIDQIAEDFEKYEKEGKDLEKEYKEAKEEPKTAKRVQPLAADDEMAKPFEEAVKTAQTFDEGGVVGLVSPKGRKTFSSSEHQRGSKLDDKGRFFLFGLKTVNGRQVINAAGRPIKIDGNTVLTGHIYRNDDGTYSYFVDNGGSEVYKSRKCYFYKSQPFTEEEFAEFKRRDAEPLRPLPPPKPGGGGISFTANPSDYHYFKTMKHILLDENMRQIRTGTGYVSTRTERVKIGDRCY